MSEASHITVNLSNSPVRHEVLQGRKYLVAPMAMITAGGHNGSNGPLLYEEGDIRKAVPAWNMKPIVAYHPSINNAGISAADPDVLERQQVGMVMAANYSGGKLRAEAWIEEERAAAVDDRVLDALTSNRVMEVSTGLFTTNEATAGKWGEEDYTAIARNHQPDHLALLPDQVGACSVADGAGLLVANAGEAGFEGAEVMDVARRIVGNKLSHSDTHQAISRELQGRVAKGKSPDEVGPWVVDVYENFGYEVAGELYKQGYTKAKGGGINFKDAPEAVVRQTSYVANHKAGEKALLSSKSYSAASGEPTTPTTTDMKDAEIVDALIENATTAWGEDDREALMGTDTAILNKMKDGMKKKGKAADGVDPDEADEEATKKATKNEEAAPAATAAAAPAEPVANTAEAYIENAPPEIQQVLRNGLNAHKAEQAQLIETITANADNTFAKEFLATKDVAELRGIAALAAKPEPVANTSPAMFVGQATPANAPAPTANVEQPLAAPTMNSDTK